MMASLHHIILALGANTQPAMGMQTAKSLLSDIFPNIRFSREIWTEPIGMEGTPFRNCIAFAATDLEDAQVLSKLKEVEILCGRLPDDRSHNIIKMDVDLLQYDSLRCHVNDWERPYIHQLMKEMEDNK